MPANISIAAPSSPQQLTSDSADGATNGGGFVDFLFVGVFFLFFFSAARVETQSHCDYKAGIKHTLQSG